MLAALRTALLLALAAPAAPAQDSPAAPAPPSAEVRVELVETAPIETTLGSDDLRDCHEVWIEQINACRSSLDLAHFYASEAPVGPDGQRPRSRLTPVIEAVERAAARGVRVRLLLSDGFRATYPDTAARLAASESVELRWLDLRPITGGTLHAKFMIFDAARVFVGSQNFDWRALEHIQELGVLVTGRELAGAFGRVFDFDWRAAAGDAPAAFERAPLAAQPASEAVVDADGARVTPVFSPAGWLPPGVDWDLPHLLRLIDGAQQAVRVSLLSYSPSDRDGGWFGELDAALRRAAARGVDVRLTVADWGKRRGRVEWLQSLVPVRSLSVRFVTLPVASQGFLPFARCVHSKFLAVDGEAAWVGTSNWSGDYFYESRNAGLVVEGGPLPARLMRFHSDTWDSPYAYDVDPAARYTPPRIGE